MKKILLPALLGAALLTPAAMAAHGSLNPMAPRQVSEAAYNKDYSYGYSILASRTVDPLDPLNRYVGWNLNYNILDRFLLRPVAHGYAHLPSPIRTGVGNFLSNLDEITNTANNLLIFEPAASGVSAARFVINSTIGLLGIFDVATMMGLEARPMRMKTVLGRWGADGGAYLMIPLLGPSSERDLHGSLIDTWDKRLLYPTWFNVGTLVLSGIHNRAELIPQEEMIDGAIDPYVQMRDAYLQYTEGKIDPNASTRVDQEEGISAEFLDEVDG
ncbi:MAG: VacJ family lipoprotein [Succinivibrionaceae bacterium]|nr:VacJ family lipoprotein [Succinivibrionaceae bacterium]